MRASAHILVQRYLDGELSELELEAFLEDLSQSPELASMLEEEVHLDAAIINDAYSIEPPAELRAAVLQSLPDVGSSWTLSVVVQMALSIAMGGVVLLTSLVGIGTDSMRRSDVSAMNPAPASSAMPLRIDCHRQEERTVISTAASKSEFSLTSEPVVESSDAFVEPTRPEHVPVETLRRSWGEQQSDRFLGLGGASVSSLPAGLVGGMVGTSMVSLRYELDLLEDSQVFVEAGGLQQPRTSTAYVNGATASVISTGISPFVSIGIAGKVLDLDLLGRSISGAAAVGVTSAGPLAMAEVSVPLTDLGPTTLDVGMRFSALFDVSGMSYSNVSAAPFVRVGISPW